MYCPLAGSLMVWACPHHQAHTSDFPYPEQLNGGGGHT